MSSRMSSLAPALTALLAAAILAPSPLQPFGFSPSSALNQAEVEEIFASQPTPPSSRMHHLRLTEDPHVAGQESQRKVADYVQRHFEASGIASQAFEYKAYLPRPQEIRIRLIEPRKEELARPEQGYEVDKDTFAQDVIAPFNAYSPSGQVEGQVVYVNYGLPADYERLDRLGVQVNGKIVLARYGRGFRGVKVRIAEQRGAAAVLLYSDPLDDGYFKGDVYPRGGMRPPSAVQRGSIQYLFIYPGDPLTPGWAAHQEAERIEPATARNLPRIPCHPLSYADAAHILETLAGPPVPEGWQGALPFTYHIGPGPARVQLNLQMDYALRPVRNVIGRIPGAVYPDQWIIVGNHIDAWTYGGVDPHSGTTALLEMATGLGELLRQGKPPQRTIILAGWDGEEYGLIGSTEWGEEFGRELRRKAVAYLNVDSAVSGPHFAAGASPSLRELVREVARSVQDPATGRSVYEAWLEHQRESSLYPPTEVAIADLGSGSDYTVFLDHLGIPSLTLGFTGRYGVYHSLYDTHYWMREFGDPAWQYHPAMARIWGRMTLRLANADILPLNFEEYGREIYRHLRELEQRFSLLPGVRIAWEQLLKEARLLEQNGGAIRRGVDKITRKAVPESRAQRINRLVREVEQSFVNEEGLPGRTWYRHVLHAPALSSGYGSRPLPGLTEAIEDGELTVATLQSAALLERLSTANRLLDQIRRLVQ